MKKLSCLVALTIFGLSLLAQTTKTIEGKYCINDDAIGKYCITFKKNGTYIVEYEHGRTSNDTGKWIMRNDTIAALLSSKIKTEDCCFDSYYLADALYSLKIEFDDKMKAYKFVRGKALKKIK